MPSPIQQEPNGDAIAVLLQRAVLGDESAMAALLDRYRDRLRHMLLLRFDRRLQGKVDPSDIIQEAYIDAALRLDQYAAEPKVPFYVWLRTLTAQRLIVQYRKHLGTRARDVSRGLDLPRRTKLEATSAVLASQLLGRLTTPSAAAIRAERQIRLQEALNQLDAIDREILAMRHFEQMSNGEVAAALDLDKSAASKRYARALLRLKDILRDMPGGLESLE